MKLGKKPARHDQRTLRLSRYALNLPAPPESIDWTGGVTDWPGYRNDVIGCCAIATVAHQLQAWTHADKDSPNYVPSEESVIAGYARCGGFNPQFGIAPGNPTDHGCVMLDVLNIWRREGLCGRKIGAYAAVNPGNVLAVKSGLHIFGGLLLGVQLPIAAEGRMDWLAPTDPAARVNEWARGSWGGHAVNVVKYDPKGLWLVSWGSLMFMSWNFFAAYCDECYVAISADWLGPDFTAPNGFDLNALIADISALN